MVGAVGFRLDFADDRLHFHLSWILYRGLSNWLGIFLLRLSSVFKNLSEDQRSAFEAHGPCLTIVVSYCPSLIVSHPDGCALSYFVCPVQIPS